MTARHNKHKQSQNHPQNNFTIVLLKLLKSLFSNCPCTEIIQQFYHNYFKGKLNLICIQINFHRIVHFQ